MKKSTKTFVVTDETLNIYGFKVRTAGIDLSRFTDNPVCTFNHDYEKIIGTWPDLQLQGTQYLGTPSFDENDTQAMSVADKIEQGIIKTASIGIFPIRVEGEWVEESELLEIAIAPVPGNKNAIVKLYGPDGNALSDKDAKALLLSVSQTTQITKNDNSKESMNDKQRMAFIALCMQAGLTLNLSATSTDEEIATAFGKIGEKITSLTLSVSQYKAADDARVLADKTAQDKDIAQRVDLAISQKLFTADKRADFIQLGALNPELLKSTLENMKPVTLSAEIPGQKEGSEKAVEAAERAAWTFEDWQKKDSVGLSAMQANESARFDQLFNAYSLKLKAAGVVA